MVRVLRLCDSRAHGVGTAINCPSMSAERTARCGGNRLFNELRHSKALNEKLTYENALLKRMKFAAQSERFSAEQRNLLEDETG
jgi:hypothetical protein